MANYIGNIPASGEFKKLDSIASSFNGSTVQFNLTYNAASQVAGDATQLIVSLNGIVQEPGAAYTLGIGGNSIIFASAPASGDTCHIVLLGGVGSTVTPTDGSVTASKLDAALKDYYEDEFTASGGTDYTLSREAVGVNQLMVTIDGIVQPTSAYSASGTTLTISPALPTGTNIRVVHMGVKAGVYVPQAGSVGLNELDVTALDNRYYQSGDSISVADVTVSGSQGEITLIDSDGPHSSQLVQSGYHLYIQTNENNGGAVRIRTTGDGSVKDRLHVNHNGDISFYEDTGADAMFFWDASTERLGVGTSSPSSKLHVFGADNNTSGGITIQESSTTYASHIYNNGNRQTFSVGSSSGSFEWKNSAGTKAVIDSSGNLLVSSSNNNTAPGVGNTDTGISLRPYPNNSIIISRASDAPLYVNRNTNAGDVIQLRSNGSLAGRIGVASGPVSYIVLNDTTSDNVAALKGAGGAILPSTNVGADMNGTMNLGSNAARFNNLFLSGGINFDAVSGNATSNTLDDYEEGTFTPIITDGTTGAASYGINGGWYVKIGNLCHISIDFRNINATNLSDSSTLYIEGLPFTVYNSGTLPLFQPLSYTPGNANNWGGYSGVFPYAYQNTNFIQIRLSNSNLTSPVTATIEFIGQGSSNRDFWISGTYRTA